MSEELSTISSGELVRSAEETAEIAARIAAALEEDTPATAEEEVSPAFKELREPKLPTLARENRARLQMQTPTRVYFYWSLKNNPWQILNRVFGDDRGSYTLVLKLINQTRDTEEIHPVDAEGNYWFNVDADSTYRAEIGFYAPNRPYFRALYSNTLTTPRKGPSPRVATDADWMVNAETFAQVLDASGFKQDAVEVALAGDDPIVSEQATREAFADLLGDDIVFEGFTVEEFRYALLALASGVPIEELRWKVSASLFALLEANLHRLSAESAVSALRDHFDIGDDEVVEEEQLSAVYGSSVVHFPKTLKKRRIPRELGEFGVPGSARPSSPSR
ncbi:MAG TPA: DUF4912 domain-containing protein [Pyrinomonadaceae bacterium]|nr:DUF4912 domain-containing protein [Pyrinomonadaceae bacterium]